MLLISAFSTGDKFILCSILCIRSSIDLSIGLTTVICNTSADEDTARPNVGTTLRNIKKFFSKGKNFSLLIKSKNGQLRTAAIRN